MSAFDLTGKVAIVTGAAGGIGEAIAIQMASAGAAVVCADLNGDGAQETAATIQKAGGRSSSRQVDVSSKTDMDDLVSSTVDEYGQLDSMVNNAGILILRPILEITPEEFTKVIEVNLNSVMYGSQAAARVMKPGSTIINLASGIIDRPSLGRASYAASKGGVHQLTRAFALELGPLGIRVAGIAPGWVVSGITRQHFTLPDGTLDEQAFAERVADRAAGSPMNEVVEADDIAHTAVFLASEAGRAFTGQIVRANGGTVMV